MLNEEINLHPSDADENLGNADELSVTDAEDLAALEEMELEEEEDEEANEDDVLIRRAWGYGD